MHSACLLAHWYVRSLWSGKWFIEEYGAWGEGSQEGMNWSKKLRMEGLVGFKAAD